MKRPRLTYKNVISTLIKVCQKRNITLVLNDPQIGEDNGLSYGKSEIHLGAKYKSNLILLAIAMHEFGHVMISRRKGRKYKKLSIFSEEVLAWTLAMQYQKLYFNRNFTRSQGNFMLDCLKTYSKDHYNFSKEYPNEDEHENYDVQLRNH